MRDRGFSLMELLIVMAVIGILSAIALPNFLRSKMTVNEGAAITTVRNLVTAQSTYALTEGFGNYASSLADLGSSGLIDQVLVAGTKDGYTFSISGDNQFFSIQANPQTYGSTGSRSFFGDHTGVIRYTTADAPADSGSPPIGS